MIKVSKNGVLDDPIWHHQVQHFEECIIYNNGGFEDIFLCFPEIEQMGLRALIPVRPMNQLLFHKLLSRKKKKKKNQSGRNHFHIRI